MTLNLRIQTPNNSIFYSDGRKVNNGNIVTEHCSKIISRQEFVLSLAGVLDDEQHANSFSLHPRLDQNLVYNPDHLQFRENVFDLIGNEYDKEFYRTEKSCVVLSSSIHNNLIENISIQIINHKCNICYQVKNCLQRGDQIKNSLLQFPSPNSFSAAFTQAINGLANDFAFDFTIDHNHMYFVNGQPMPSERRYLMGPLFLSAYFDIKGQLPTSQEIDNCTEAELEDIGIRFYDKHNMVIPHPAIGNFEEVKVLRIP